MQPITTSLVHSVAVPSQPGDGQAPALVLLHGRGSNEEDLLGLAPHFDPRFFIIAARAPLRFPYGGYTWYDVIETGKPDPAQFSESCGKLSQFLADVKTGYPIDPRRLFLFGFSMGSMMSLTMALSQPQDVRGVVAHSGSIPERTALTYRWKELQHTAFFVAHGIFDPVVPIDFGRRTQQLLAAADADIVYREYPIPHTISDESLHDAGVWLTQKLDATV